MIKIRAWLFFCMVQSGLFFSCLAASVLDFMDVSEYTAAYHYPFFPALFRDKWYVFFLVIGIVLLLSLTFSFHRLIDVSRNKGIEISGYEECVIVGTSIIDLVFVLVIIAAINRFIYRYETVLPDEFGVVRHLFWVSITEFILSLFVFRGIRKTGTGDGSVSQSGPASASVPQSDGRSDKQ